MADQTATQENLLTTSRFAIEIDGVIQGLFKECTGLEMKTELITYNSVNNKGVLFTQKVPGHNTYSDITLKKSLDGAKDLISWRMDVINGDYTKFRKDGYVTLYDSKLTQVARWQFKAAWPTDWKFAQLDANANDILLEEITFAVEEITRAD
jgi:phage tail-like protein